MDSKIRKGAWFHSMKDFLIRHQGQITEELPHGVFRIQLYSFLDGSPTVMFDVRRSYFHGALFYGTDKEMREAYDKNYSFFADRKAGESSAEFFRRKDKEEQ